MLRGGTCQLGSHDHGQAQLDLYSAAQTTTSPSDIIYDRGLTGIDVALYRSRQGSHYEVSP